MKSILISIKPKWVAKILNGDKTIEVRKNKALANAIQKLIDEYGYADIYVYCSKDKSHFLVNADLIRPPFPHPRKYMLGHKDYSLNGKVIFKFCCYNVEEIETCERHNPELLLRSCLNANEFYDYLMKGKNFLDRVLGCAIHISDLEIFDRPKELSEFHLWEKDKIIRLIVNNTSKLAGECLWKPLTKAPQNFAYVEVE